MRHHDGRSARGCQEKMARSRDQTSFGTAGTPEALRSPPMASREPRRLLSSTPFRVIWGMSVQEGHMQNELKTEDAPLITIITPTYDREELLTYAYRSFTSQSIGNLEWIVLDDSEKPSIFMTTLDDPRVR